MNLNWIRYVFLTVVFYMSVKAFAHASTDTTAFKNLKLNTVSTKLASSTLTGSDLYEQIKEDLEDHYQEVGERLSDRVLADNNGLYAGLNEIGFKYAKEYGTFDISLNRRLAPDLFHDSRWIVTDEFEIDVSASKVLNRLSNNEDIAITETQLGLFAGVKFKRKYRFIHYAKSYQGGLTGGFNNLFMVFEKFKNRNYFNMLPGEMIHKEDFLSLKGGGVIKIPVNTSVSIQAALLGKYERLSKVEVISPLEETLSSLSPDNNERLQISIEKTTGASIGAHASINADFLNILKLTLFSFDYEYSYSESYKNYFGFSQNDIHLMKGDEQLLHEMDLAMKGKAKNLKILTPFIVSFEKRKKQGQLRRYTLLLRAGMKKSQTEQIEKVKDGVRYTFFKHHFEKTKTKQNLRSRLFSDLSKKYLDQRTLIGNDLTDQRRTSILYEASENLVKLKKDLDIEEKEFHLSLNHFYSIKKNRKRYKKKAQGLLENYTGVDPFIASLFKNGSLRAPIEVEGFYKISNKGIDHLNQLPSSKIYQYIKSICRSSSKGVFSLFRSLFSSCKRRAKRSYEKYVLELHHHSLTRTSSPCRKRKWWSFKKRYYFSKKCMLRQARKNPSLISKDIPVWRLKNFVDHIYLNSKSKVDIFNIYGVGNVKFSGRLSALKNDDTLFIKNFSMTRR